MGLISTGDLPDPQYENPLQVFQSIQKKIKREGHQPYHSLFYQILLRRLWQTLNHGVHIRHLTHLLPQYFRLSCP